MVMTRGRPCDLVSDRTEDIALAMELSRSLPTLQRLINRLAAHAVRANELESRNDSEAA